MSLLPTPKVSWYPIKDNTTKANLFTKSRSILSWFPTKLKLLLPKTSKCQTLVLVYSKQKQHCLYSKTKPKIDLLRVKSHIHDITQKLTHRDVYQTILLEILYEQDIKRGFLQLNLPYHRGNQSTNVKCAKSMNIQIHQVTTKSTCIPRYTFIRYNQNGIPNNIDNDYNDYGDSQNSSNNPLIQR